MNRIATLLSLTLIFAATSCFAGKGNNRGKKYAHTDLRRGTQCGHFQSPHYRNTDKENSTAPNHRVTQEPDAEMAKATHIAYAAAYNDNQDVLKALVQHLDTMLKSNQ